MKKTFVSFIVAVILPLFLFSPWNAQGASFTPRKVGFQIGLMDPYPSPVGFGISYFFDQFLGISGLTGIRSTSDSRLTTFTGGLRFMATREKISSTAFLGFSSFESEQGSRMGVGYLGIGLNLSISDHAYISAGANFGLTPRDGKTETLPYVQFGVTY